MDLEINSSLDLYKRLTPAMNCKVRELEKLDMTYIKKEDIWNYLMRNKWKTKGVPLADMVDDILNLNNKILDDFVKGKLSYYEEKVDLGEVELL